MKLARERRSIRFRPDEWSAVESVAHREGVTASELIREIVVRAVQRRAKGP